MGFNADTFNSKRIAYNRNGSRTGKGIEDNLTLSDFQFLENLLDPLRSKAGRVTKPSMDG